MKWLDNGLEDGMPRKPQWLLLLLVVGFAALLVAFLLGYIR